MKQVAVVTLLLAMQGGASADKWDLVRDLLTDYFPLPDMGFTAGDATGQKFEFAKGSVDLDSPLMLASAGKFPAAVAVAGAVARGKITFDTYAHEVLPWWTSDAADKRSRVTLRRLLSFTSGFDDKPPWGAVGDEAEENAVTCMTIGPAAMTYTAEACAQEIYEKAPFPFEPGSTWSYNSFHLQIAALMAAKASGLTVPQLLQENLVKAGNLTATSWLGNAKNPILAAAMSTSGNDYDKILRGVLSYQLIPKEVADEMERDYLEAPVKSAASSTTLEVMLGHYSMCLYFECLPPKSTFFTEACKKRDIHMDAGLFGWYPLFDRSQGTYMQVVAFRFPKGKADFFLPTALSSGVRVLIKPSVDIALHTSSPSAGAGSPALGLQGWQSSREAIWNVTAEVLSQSPLKDNYPTPEALWRAAGVEPPQDTVLVV